VDALYDASATTQTWCGQAKVHTGFAVYLDEFRRMAGGMSMISKMRSKSTCGNGIVTIGHSLGGALATLFAVCANRKSQGFIWNTFLQGIKVKELYTFGAPEVARVGTRNGQRKSGCFTGARFYNEPSYTTFDPVPLSARGVVSSYYKHTLVNAVRLQDNNHIVHSCTKNPESVRKYPEYSRLRLMGDWKTDLSQHKTTLYRKRVNKAAR
jgi:hypothetical protein